MKIKPDYDVALVVHLNGINIHFCRVPSSEVANLLFAIAENPGITLPAEGQDRYGLIHSNRSCVSTPDRQRLYYWMEISPVYEVGKVGRSLAEALRDLHGLTVCYREEFPPNDNDTRVILKPVKTD